MAEKRVAVLLVKNLTEALRLRQVEAADSEPYWLGPGQFRERGAGVELLPAMAGDLMAYARQNELHPLGIVVLHENGGYSDYINEDAIEPLDRQFATKLFQAHAHFWFCVMPWLTEQRSDA